MNVDESTYTQLLCSIILSIILKLQISMEDTTTMKYGTMKKMNLIKGNVMKVSPTSKYFISFIWRNYSIFITISNADLFLLTIFLQTLFFLYCIMDNVKFMFCNVSS